jgi:hypothetical protein
MLWTIEVASRLHDGEKPQKVAPLTMARVRDSSNRPWLR